LLFLDDILAISPPIVAAPHRQRTDAGGWLVTSGIFPAELFRLGGQSDSGSEGEAQIFGSPATTFG
jgi:hypothetical protein